MFSTVATAKLCPDRDLFTSFTHLSPWLFVLLRSCASLSQVCPNSLLSFGQYISHGYLVEFLPGKRALAIGLCIYHSTVSTVLFQAPRFIPHSFGPLFETYVYLLIIPLSLTDLVTTDTMSHLRSSGVLSTDS